MTKDPAKLSYIAGMFEGAGRVSVPSRNKGRQDEIVSVKIVFSSPDSEVLRSIKEDIGFGRVYERDSEFVDAELVISGARRVRQIIGLLLRRTVSKQEELKLGLTLLDLIKKRPGLFYSDEEREQIYSLIKQIREVRLRKDEYD